MTAAFAVTGISKRYPTVEATSALLSAYAAWHFGFGAAALGALLFVWAMVALTFIDLDTQLLPDDITLPLLWLGLAFNLGATYAGWTPVAGRPALAAAAGAGLALVVAGAAVLATRGRAPAIAARPTTAALARG